MPAVSSILDRLLRLGNQILEAVEADRWARVEELVERRTEVAQALEESEDPVVENDLSDAEQQEMVDALDAQNQRLTALLRTRREEIEDELTQIGQMRNAQDSYDTGSSQSGALPPELRG